MGSWNDVYVKDNDLVSRYRAATDRLYDSVVGALHAAVNSSPSPTAP